MAIQPDTATDITQALRDAFVWTDFEDNDEFGRPIDYNVVNALMLIGRNLGRVADALSRDT
jgi:hypothetical protein